MELLVLLHLDEAAEAEELELVPVEGEAVLGHSEAVAVEALGAEEGEHGVDEVGVVDGEEELDVADVAGAVEVFLAAGDA